MKKIFLMITMTLAVSIVVIGCTQKSELTTQPEVTSTALQQEKNETNKPDHDVEETDSSSDELAPVYGSALNDGTYPIEVKSSSSMFRIIDAKLTVENGNMTVLMTLSGTGYLRLYMGTEEQAVQASDEDFIYYVENSEGKYTYEVPIKALNQDTACTAWSIKKERWYDRVLFFQSESLPSEAFKTPSNSAITLDNGKYHIDAAITGGTGKATIKSPMELTVADGETVAKIEWNSPYYDYMIINENKYAPISTDGNAVFEIPMEKMEDELNIIADTTAMSEPHEIEYILKFNLNSVKRAE